MKQTYRNKFKKNPYFALQFLLKKMSCIIKDDKTYVSLMYFFGTGKKLNLKKPKVFTEKLQWLKLYDRKPQYTRMVDKYEAKKYVAILIGEQYIIPTLGVWNSFDEIDFEQLPNQFVLKTTHDSGGFVICKDKSLLNKKKARKKLEHSLKTNFYISTREYPYKDVKPRIIAEQYINNSNGEELSDYKFFCFNGEPKFCQVIANRFTNQTFDFYDMEWLHQPFTGLSPYAQHAQYAQPKPKGLEKMIEIARILSENMTFVRIDLYDVNNQIYFGEITFYPSSGTGRFTPELWNKKIGDLIELSQI